MINVRSEVRGHIKWLLLCFDGDDRHEYLALIRALLQSLPNATRLLICCLQSEYADFLKQELGESLKEALRFVKFGRVPQQGKCFLWVPKNTERYYGLWCRDPVLVRNTLDQAALMLCKTAYERDNYFLCDALAGLRLPGFHFLKETGRKGADLYLSGGNLLADENFLLTGYKEFQLSWQNGSEAHGDQYFFKDETAAVTALLDWANGKGLMFYNKAYLVGKGAPFLAKDGLWGDSIFAHIDCYLSLTATRVTDASGCSRYVLLLAKADRILLPENTLRDREDGILQTLNNFLDSVAQQLADTGDFEVWRNSVPVFAHCAWDEDTARSYPVRFYLGLLNNVLVQAVNDAKLVWLPRLGGAKFLTGADEYLAHIEDENAALWTKLGYEVRFIDANFHPFWHWSGGLRCMTMDLVRDFGN